jgi:hypothetical protein
MKLYKNSSSSGEGEDKHTTSDVLTITVRATNPEQEVSDNFSYYWTKADRLEQERILFNLKLITQQTLNTIAQSRDYDSIESLCSYAASDVEKYQKEGKAGCAWRDACWAKYYEAASLMEKNGSSSCPSTDDYLASLPNISW